MALLSRYVAQVRVSLDGSAFFLAAAFCALSLWLVLTVEIGDPLQSIAFAVLLLPLFMLPAAVPVALFAVTWAFVRHKTIPITFSAGWLLICGASTSALQFLAPSAHDSTGYTTQALALAAAGWSVQLAACAFIYARLAGSKSSHVAAASSGA